MPECNKCQTELHSFDNFNRFHMTIQPWDIWSGRVSVSAAGEVASSCPETWAGGKGGRRSGMTGGFLQTKVLFHSRLSFFFVKLSLWFLTVELVKTNGFCRLYMWADMSRLWSVSVLILSVLWVWTAYAGLGWLSCLLLLGPVWSPSLLVQVSQGSPLHTRSTGTSSETSPASSPCGPAQTRSTPCCTGRTPGTLALCAARSWCASWRCDTSPWSGESWHSAPLRDDQ